MQKMREYVDIRDYTTLKVGGQFHYFVEVSDQKDLGAIYEFARSKNLPVNLLGGGSNMVFPDGVYESVVIKIEIPGFELINDEAEYSDIKIGAGENWDSVVARVVKMNLSGIEALSAIPGTTGATPVQNVGAYGQEIKDTLLSIEVFDTKDKNFKTLIRQECKFAYRDSIFKGKEKGRYVIISVTLRLLKRDAAVPHYPGVKKYFLEKNIHTPTLLQIREAIIDIRKNKLPDPKEISNVGSFFKNPIVTGEVATTLKIAHPEITLFPTESTMVKVPAGWLMEHAGLKGKNFGPLSLYKNNALVLVNNGSATRADVMDVTLQIQKIIFDAFGIMLETEPEFV